MEGPIRGLCARRDSTSVLIRDPLTCDDRQVEEKISKREGMSKRIVEQITPCFSSKGEGEGKGRRHLGAA